MINSGKSDRPAIGILGASFDTGNMGVGALAASTIKCILRRWPGAYIVLLDSGREVGVERIRVGHAEVTVHKLPIRFCPNIFLANHFVVVLFCALWLRLIPNRRLQSRIHGRNTAIGHLMSLDRVVDITGGDSFSDIYGMRRFVLGFLRKWIVLLLRKDLIMLPQTYGPFKGRLAKSMARYILRRSKIVYSRDKAGLDYVNSLLHEANGRVRFSPDMAFILDAREPVRYGIEPAAILCRDESLLVGLNVSGLLYNGGYSRDNMFGLRWDYKKLVVDVGEMLLRNERVVLLLIPHVFPKADDDVESDPKACRELYSALRSKYEGRVFLATGEYDQSEVKYLIGTCDFLIGSRMHACIAALSQFIPAVGIAYSKKFYGVFASVGVPECVLDARDLDEQSVLERIEMLISKRDELSERLKKTVPGVYESVLRIFDESLQTGGVR